jgi:hypothetical protein
MFKVGEIHKDGDGHEVEVLSGPTLMGHYFCMHKDVLMERSEIDFETGRSQRKRKLYDTLIVHDQDGAAIGAGESFDIGAAGRRAKGKGRQ